MNATSTFLLWLLLATTVPSGGPARSVLMNNGAVELSLRNGAVAEMSKPVHGTNGSATLTSRAIMVRLLNVSTNTQTIRYHRVRSLFLELVDDQGNKIAKTAKGVAETGTAVLPPSAIRSRGLRSWILRPGEKAEFFFDDPLEDWFEIRPGRIYRLHFRFLYWSFEEQKFVLSDRLQYPVVFPQRSETGITGRPSARR